MRVLAIAVSFALAACSDHTALSPDAVANIELQYDFSTGFQGWDAAFADYPVGKEAEWGLNASLATLPAPLETTRRGPRPCAGASWSARSSSPWSAS